MLQHQAALAAKGAPLSRIQLDMGFTPLDPPPEQMVELVRRNLAGEFEDTKSDQDKFLRCSTFKWSRGRLTSWVVRGGGGEEVR